MKALLRTLRRLRRFLFSLWRDFRATVVSAAVREPRTYSVIYIVETRARCDTLLNIVSHEMGSRDGVSYIELRDAWGHLYVYNLATVTRVRATGTPKELADFWPLDEEHAL